MNFKQFVLNEGLIVPKFTKTVTKKQFCEVGWIQRGKPESAMLAVGKAVGGGLLPWLCEHVGDLTHRMSEDVTYSYGGYAYVLEKVDRALRALTSGYGFEREVLEQLHSNAVYFNIPFEQYKTKVDKALKKYVEEHKKVPVYNQAQWLCREAAITLGDWRFWTCTACLEVLKGKLNLGSEAWTIFAHENVQDENGK